jgi:hypothetical protein
MGGQGRDFVQFGTLAKGQWYHTFIIKKTKCPTKKKPQKNLVCTKLYDNSI